MNDLPPKVIVFRGQERGKRVDPVHMEQFHVYSDDTLRVLKMYDVGATAYQGQWVIRIDTYE